MRKTLYRVLHALTSRHPWRVSPGCTVHGQTLPAFEVCDQCDAFRPIVLPDGHPESLTAELTREEEDYLGWLADQLWPEVADREMADAARTNAFGDESGDESADDPQMGGA